MKSMCSNCGIQAVRNRGRCAACNLYWRNNGEERPQRFAVEAAKRREFRANMPTFNADLRDALIDEGAPKRLSVSIAEKTRESSSGCWLWIGATNSEGYAHIRHKRGLHYVHRMVYEILESPIPDGLHIDHLCRMRNCVNPEHLDPVTCQENVLRGTSIGAKVVRRNRCMRGHSMDDAYERPDGLGRSCRECKRMRDRMAS